MTKPPLLQQVNRQRIGVHVLQVNCWAFLARQEPASYINILQNPPYSNTLGYRQNQRIRLKIWEHTTYTLYTSPTPKLFCIDYNGVNKPHQPPLRRMPEGWQQKVQYRDYHNPSITSFLAPCHSTPLALPMAESKLEDVELLPDGTRCHCPRRIQWTSGGLTSSCRFSPASQMRDDSARLNILIGFFTFHFQSDEFSLNARGKRRFSINYDTEVALIKFSIIQPK